jgi:hypothetical protein
MNKENAIKAGRQAAFIALDDLSVESYGSVSNAIATHWDNLIETFNDEGIPEMVLVAEASFWDVINKSGVQN